LDSSGTINLAEVKDLLTPEEQVRAEERAEKLKKKVRDENLDIEAQARQTLQGMVSQYDAVHKKGRQVDWRQSYTARDGSLKEVSVPIPDDAFKDVPKVVKRTPQERLDSLTKRLVDEMKKGGVNQALVEGILQQVTDMAAANGQLISTDQLRQLAEYFLNQAEANSKGK